MKKKLLVDLSPLDNIFEGYGQISLNYGKYFQENYNPADSPYELTLLLPKKYFGAFGKEVKYLSSTNWWRRHCRYLFPKFDIWHSLWHRSRFKPYSKHTKFIYTVHDLNCLLIDYEESEERIAKYYRRIKRKLRRASVIALISEFVRRQVEEIYGITDNRLQVIYNGVRDLTDIPQQKPLCCNDEQFFFYISAFRPKKNFHLLLDMMKLMPDKKLYLAGNYDTEYGRMIKRRIEEEKIENVVLSGAVSEEEKAWLYANCEAFLFPSSFEGFGLPVIEAMQFGKPVFSSKETSLKEIGSQYAYFWEVLEPEQMKKTIEDNLDKFYANPQLADSERDYALSYSYEKHFAEYEKIYSSF